MQAPQGGVVEWLMAPVLKTGDPKGSVGSNPTPSVMTLQWHRASACAAHGSRGSGFQNHGCHAGINLMRYVH